MGPGRPRVLHGSLTCPVGFGSLSAGHLGPPSLKETHERQHAATGGRQPAGPACRRGAAAAARVARCSVPAGECLSAAGGPVRHAARRRCPRATSGRLPAAPARRLPAALRGAPAGYPQPAGVDIGSGFSWAWKAFTQNALAFVIGTLLWAVVIGVVWSVVFAVFGGFSRLADNAGASYFAVASTGFAGIASTLLSSLLSGLFIASLLGAAFKVADGRAVSVGDLFDFSAISPKFVLALLFAIASLVAGLIPFLGALLSLAIYYFGFFAFHLLVDRARPRSTRSRRASRCRRRTGAPRS